jgi:hypothetical protein
MPYCLSGDRRSDLQTYGMAFAPSPIRVPTMPDGFWTTNRRLSRHVAGAIVRKIDTSGTVPAFIPPGLPEILSRNLHSSAGQHACRSRGSSPK